MRHLTGEFEKKYEPTNDVKVYPSFGYLHQLWIDNGDYDRARGLYNSGEP
ncbi:hypothetical protein F2Q69_00014714 [Brassica cretica]|uniref:Uncharacterized protein n=2 Tax=Brassica cretica TaxID=69181 RepID=A0ABQ7DLV7_BRACR|nr:hypothetical protein F2Q69_00014714 [Brassica cretica]KAF3578335.1 hypothetical protein DY000_02032246 [Brassica cretica]